VTLREGMMNECNYQVLIQGPFQLRLLPIAFRPVMNYTSNYTTRNGKSLGGKRYSSADPRDNVSWVPITLRGPGSFAGSG